MILECESPILQDVASKLADIHEESEAIAEQQARALGRKLAEPDMKWKWTGSSFVKSPTMEPWVRNRGYLLFWV